MGDEAKRLGVTIAGGFLIHPVTLGLAIGSVIGGLLFPSRREQTGQARIQNLSVTTSQKGEPIPVTWGTQRVAGNLIWYGNFKKQEASAGGKGKGGGKGGGQGKGGGEQVERYSASFAVGICEGPISSVSNIWAGKDKIDMTLEGSKFRVYTGTASQTADPHISGILAKIPIEVPRESVTPPAVGSVGTYTALKTPITSGTVQAWYYHAFPLQRRNFTVVANTPSADEIRLVDRTLGTFQVGWPSQSPNVNIQLQYERTPSQSYVAVPYRHTAYVVFMDWDLGPSASMPNFSFEVTHLVKGLVSDSFNRADGDVGNNWISDVPLFEIISNELKIRNNNLDNAVMTRGGGEIYAADQFAECMLREVLNSSFGGLGVRLVNSPRAGYVFSRIDNLNGTTALRIVRADLSEILASVTITTGSRDDWAAGKKIRIEVRANTVKCFVDGREVLSVTNTSYPSGGTPGFAAHGGIAGTFWKADDFLGGDVDQGTPFDVNPVEILKDWLTNDRYGAGIPLSSIPQNSATWNAVAEAITRRDLNVSPVIADRARASDHVEHLLSYFDGMLAYTQGEFKLKMRRDDETAVTSLTNDDYASEKMPTFGRMAQRETRNRLRLEWLNRADDYVRAVAEAYDDWSIQETGERQESVQLPGITRKELAQPWIQRALWESAVPRLMLPLEVGPRHSLLEPGDLVTLTHSEVDIVSRRMRILTISEAPQKRFALDLMEEPTATTRYGKHVAQDGELTHPTPDANVEPGDTIAAIFEVPAELPATFADVPVLGIAATGVTSQWAGCDIYVSRDNQSFTLAGGIRQARATMGHITSAMPAAPRAGLYDNELATTAADFGIAFGSLSGVNREEMLAGARMAVLGAEFVQFQRVTLVTSYTYRLNSMLRGLFDTSPTSKGIGTQLVLLDSAIQHVGLLRQDVGKPIYLKLPSVSIFGKVQDITSVQAMSFTPQGLRLQPDPPSNVQINSPAGRGLERIGTGELDLTYSWLYRHQNNVEDIEINSGVVLGRAADFKEYVVRLYSGVSSATLALRQTYATTSETLTYFAASNRADGVGSYQMHVRADITIRDTDGDESPIATRQVEVLLT